MSAVPARPWWRTPAGLLAGAGLLVGALAPLLANDVPLWARIDGVWHFPAFAECFGRSVPGPGDGTWKQWWAALPNGSRDFACMPPWPYGPQETNTLHFGGLPSFAHPFGNDDTGRDVLARSVHALRAVVAVGGPAVLLAGVVGTLLGGVAGLRGGRGDAVVLRLVEVTMCFPMLLFLLFGASFLGDSRLGVVAVLAMVFWPSFARIVRSELRSLREREFVQVARGLGVGEWRIFTHHLLPQLWSPVGVTAAFCMASAAVAESTLSFLGIGPGQEASSFGSLLRQGVANAHLGAWHLWLFPSVALVLVVVCCHALAERLRRGPCA
jgi:peptide/nickel transport system permease protein